MNNLNFLLDEIGFNQKTLAQLFGISASTISQYVTNNRKISNLNGIILSRFFQCDKSFLKDNPNGTIIIESYNHEKSAINETFVFDPVFLNKEDYLKFKKDNYLFISLKPVFNSEIQVVRFGFKENEIDKKELIRFVGLIFLQTIYILELALKDKNLIKDFKNPLFNMKEIEKVINNLGENNIFSLGCFTFNYYEK